MKPAFALALLLLLSSLAVSDDSPKLATVGGTVVKEPGDQPLKKVLLHLIAESQSEAGNYTADTDSEGHFRIENVQAGRYRLMLEKTGFHQVNARGRQEDGAVLTVQPGQDLTDLFFQMLSSSVIRGRVVDEDGDPLPNFGVTLLKRKPGRSSQLELAGEERTNDLGEYRFGGVFPGRYFLAVVPPPDIRNFEHIKESPEASARPSMSYLPTYYPGTIDSSQSSPIDIHAGDEMPVNFTLIPSRSYRIRGIVTGVAASQKPMVQLVSRGVIQTMNGSDVNTDGQFEIRGVPPGSYYVYASATSDAQTLTARQPVNVVAADLEGIKLVPVRPFTVTGSVRFEDFWPKDASQYSVFLQPADEDTEGGFSYFGPGGTSRASLDRTGEFRLAGVVPGKYIVQFGGSADSTVFLKSVLLGQNNYDNGLKLSGPASLELVVSSKAGLLEGVAADGDKPASGATVVAVPEERYRQIHERYGISTTDQHGRFTICGLAPGDYTVYAFEDLNENLYYDPEFLKAQEGSGMNVRVAAGSRQKIEVKLSLVGEEWR